jgi:DNA-binding transcriptional ArsR family regulator
MAQLPLRLAWKLEVRDHSDLTPMAKLYAYTLSSYMDDLGVCWPGRETIAKAMNVSEPTVKRARRELEAAGLIEVEERPGRSSIYRASFDVSGGFTHDPPGGSPMTRVGGHP